MTNIIGLTDDGGSTYVVDYKWTTYRFLLSNGNTIDVRAVTNDSNVSTEVLKVANGLEKLPENYGRNTLAVTIVGSTALPEPDKVAKPVKKTPAKRTGRARAEALQQESA